jgi:aminopeptidase N
MTARATPRLVPGVARTLARWRAQHYSQVRYDLRLRVGAAAGSLDGELRVAVSVTRAPVDLVLDWRPAAGGALRDIRVNGVPATRARAVREHLVVPASAVRRGTNTVALGFSVPIATSGTAVTRYQDGEDGSRYVYSLFVPSDASTVFPCFDQPDLKARFGLELETPALWRAVSNAPARTVERARGVRRTRFALTAPISTYLFAFAAGPFAALDERGAQRAPVSRLYVRASRAAHARRMRAEIFGLHRQGVEYLADWLGGRFPFPKHDLVLVPEFPYGGMEHAGATFLREEAVLLPAAATRGDRLRRAQLLFHETAHQWVGNLVTMRWFDDLWLKEAFANFLAAKAAAAIVPALGPWAAFAQLKAAALRTDATRGATPLHRPLANLSAAKSQYGSIVYGKGPALLRQAEFYLGPAPFRRAVRAFLRAHAYGVADWRDLVRALEHASGRALGKWAAAWVRRRGMPTVRVRWRASGTGTTEALELVQSDGLGTGTVWPLRLELALGRAAGKLETVAAELSGRRAVVPLAGRAAPRFVFANHGDFGYGRFPFDRRSRAAVLAGVGSIRDRALRALLLDALWEEVRDARLAPLAYLEVALDRLGAESDEIVVATLLGRVEQALRRYLGDAQRAAALPRVEALLAAGMRTAPAAGLRLEYLRAFAAVATTATGRTRIKRLLSGAETIPGVALRGRDRYRLVERLFVTGDAAAGRLLAAAAAADRSDDARRFAFAAGAARADAATKAHYFAAFVGDPALPESWIEAALGPFNAVEHSALTAPYLPRALAALPDLKRRRKIFFVERWLAAFLRGRTDAAALAAVRRFLARARLERDLRLKVLEAADEPARTVRIRARFAQG